jgi:hypothetical protein
MLAEMMNCDLDNCQNVGGNWFMLIGGLLVAWLVYRFAP